MPSCNLNAKCQCLGQRSDSFDLSPILDDKLQPQCPMSMLWFNVEYKDDKNSPTPIKICCAFQIAELCHRIPMWSLTVKSCIWSVWHFGDLSAVPAQEKVEPKIDRGVHIWHCKINSGIQKKSFQDNWVTSKKKKNFLDLNQPWETNYSD